MAIGDVEDLELAADVVAVRLEAHLHRLDHAHVAENRALLHVRVVRGQENTHVQFLGQVDVFLLHHLEGFAETCRRPDEGLADALELHDFRALGGFHLHLLGVAALGLAELHGGEAIAVQCAVDVGVVELQRAARHDAGLAVRVGALADELHLRLHDEVARHRAIRELELVALGPDVHAAGGQGVDLRHAVVGRVAGDLGRTHVAVRGEVTERSTVGRGRRRRGERERCKQERHLLHLDPPGRPDGHPDLDALALILR